MTGVQTCALPISAEALYDLSLELIGADCLGAGSHYGVMDLVWSALFPKIPALLSEDPLRVAAAVSNAVYNLEQESSVDTSKWAEQVEKITGLCSDAGQFLDAGKVLAWRCGMAHYRNSAIKLLDNLPEKLILEIIGLSRDSSGVTKADVIQSLEDPWITPKKIGSGHKKSLKIVAKAGGFRGFGGPFVTPPQVASTPERLYAFDNECCYSIFADSFGVTMQRYGPDIPNDVNGSNHFKLDKSGKASKGNYSAESKVFKGYSSYASTEDTMAVTLPRSHQVFIVALI